jgi:hypothetical protein
MKIFVFKDLQVFSNSAHFLVTQIDEFFTVYSLYHKEFMPVYSFTLSRIVSQI